MSNSNQVQTWRFGRTRALFITQKLLNRAKNRGAERRSEFFSCVQFNFFGVQNIQLEHKNCKIKSILSGLVTRRLYFKKKYDTKQPKFPPGRNWPIYARIFPVGAFSRTRMAILCCNAMRSQEDKCGRADESKEARGNKAEVLVKTDV